MRKRASVLCVVDDRALLVGLEEPVLARTLWFPPGGAIEPSETAAQAAEREAFEETGYATRCVELGAILRYPFTWAGRTFDCETHFFDAVLTKSDPVGIPTDPLVVAVEWVPVSELSKRLTYSDPLRGFLLRRYAELAQSRKLQP